MAHPHKKESKSSADKKLNRLRGRRMTAGSESGEGRLQKAKARAEDAKHEHPQKV